MSRAFMKETDAGSAKLLERLISSHRNFVTEKGLAASEASIGRLRRYTGLRPTKATPRLPLRR
jgi:hypothetical protein